MVVLSMEKPVRRDPEAAPVPGPAPSAAPLVEREPEKKKSSGLCGCFGGGSDKSRGVVDEERHQSPAPPTAGREGAHQHAFDESAFLDEEVEDSATTPQREGAHQHAFDGSAFLDEEDSAIIVEDELEDNILDSLDVRLRSLDPSGGENLRSRSNSKEGSVSCFEESTRRSRNENRRRMRSSEGQRDHCRTPVCSTFPPVVQSDGGESEQADVQRENAELRRQFRKGQRELSAAERNLEKKIRNNRELRVLCNDLLRMLEEERGRVVAACAAAAGAAAPAGGMKLVANKKCQTTSTIVGGASATGEQQMQRHTAAASYSLSPNPVVGGAPGGGTRQYTQAHPQDGINGGGGAFVFYSEGGGGKQDASQDEDQGGVVLDAYKSRAWTLEVGVFDSYKSRAWTLGVGVLGAYTEVVPCPERSPGGRGLRVSPSISHLRTPN